MVQMKKHLFVETVELCCMPVSRNKELQGLSRLISSFSLTIFIHSPLLYIYYGFFPESLSLFLRVVERVLINCQNDVCPACTTLLRNTKVNSFFFTNTKVNSELQSLDSLCPVTSSSLHIQVTDIFTDMITWIVLDMSHRFHLR